MKCNNITAAFAVYMPVLLYSAEPSAFGAGNLENPNPYGLTSKEKIVLENKKNLHRVEMKSNSQENVVDSLRERIDGLQSIVESLSRKSQANKQNIKKLESKNLKQFENMELYSKRLSEEIQNNYLNIQKNTEAIQRIKLAISELSKVLDTINSNYISKDEFNVLVNDVNEFKTLVISEFKKIKLHSVEKKSDFSNMSNSDVATKAKYHFEKKKYSKAIKHYRYLITKNYRPANSHYMIGEIYFRQKDYSDAISYFKKSASLYKKANYAPKLLSTLMLHTAISMHRTKDYRNAKAFYNAIIAKYPDSKNALEAQKKLESMK